MSGSELSASGRVRNLHGRIVGPAITQIVIDFFRRDSAVIKHRCTHRMRLCNRVVYEAVASIFAG